MHQELIDFQVSPQPPLDMGSRDDDSQGHTKSYSSLKDRPPLEPQSKEERKPNPTGETNERTNSGLLVYVMLCSFPPLTVRILDIPWYPMILLFVSSATLSNSEIPSLPWSCSQGTSGEPPETSRRRLPMPLGGETSNHRGVPLPVL